MGRTRVNFGPRSGYRGRLGRNAHTTDPPTGHVPYRGYRVRLLPGPDFRRYTHLLRLNDCARSLVATCFGLAMVICRACSLTNSSLTMLIRNTRLANIDTQTGPDSIQEYSDSCIQQLKSQNPFDWSVFDVDVCSTHVWLRLVYKIIVTVFVPEHRNQR